MSKRVGADFKKLNSYLNSYTLFSYTVNELQIEECKVLHKKLYGIMVFIAEYSNHNKTSSSLSIYLNEMASDLLLSLFNWVQGMYKPSKLELRCAIENFLKSLLSIEEPLILKEKRVYEIFSLAINNKHFNNKIGRKSLIQLRNIYAILCLTAHSAPSKIHSTSALKLLPYYNKCFSRELKQLYVKVVENCMATLFVNYPEIVDKMHPYDKKDFLDCLSKTTKKEVNEYLYN